MLYVISPEPDPFSFSLFLSLSVTEKRKLGFLQLRVGYLGGKGQQQFRVSDPEGTELYVSLSKVWEKGTRLKKNDNPKLERSGRSEAFLSEVKCMEHTGIHT